MDKILIIKLGAKGDVVRTLGIARALIEKYPERKIIWVTKESNKEIVKANKSVQEVFGINETDKILNQEFEIAINLDVEEEATELINKIKSKDKRGFYSESGYAGAYLPEGEYYLNTMFDDELKKVNKKTYQEMIWAAAGLQHNLEDIPSIKLDLKEKLFADKFIEINKLSNKEIIGIHVGASPRWPSKEWNSENIKEFVRLVKKEGKEVILFGGPDDVEKHEKLIRELEKDGLKIFRNNPKNSDLEFVALVEKCSKMICGDSFSLHVAIALKKPTVGLFFCTSPDEIEGYGFVKKIVSRRFGEFFPERMNEYDEDLTKSISAEEVIQELDKI